MTVIISFQWHIHNSTKLEMLDKSKPKNPKPKKAQNGDEGVMDATWDGNY